MNNYLQTYEWFDFLKKSKKQKETVWNADLIGKYAIIEINTYDDYRKGGVKYNDLLYFCKITSESDDGDFVHFHIIDYLSWDDYYYKNKDSWVLKTGTFKEDIVFYSDDYQEVKNDFDKLSETDYEDWLVKKQTKKFNL